MYQIENLGQIVKTRRWSQIGVPAVSRTVILLGLTSFFTDISSEMVVTVLPLYMILTLSLPPLQFGLVDGIQQGASALVRVLFGFLSDRMGRPKEVAAAGYTLSALCRAGLLAVGGLWTGIAAVVLADRIGKGIRTAPRDAMISLTTPRGELGTAFGVHRAMDTAGALLGPLIAFALLALLPGGYDAVFVVSLCFALVGLGVISLFVRNPAPDAAAPSPRAEPVAVGEVLRLIRARGMGALVAVGALLSLATVSDAFVYLAVQQKSELPTAYFPLLFVATALVFMLLAVPAGGLADRFGRRRVFVAGYGLLLAAYALLLSPAPPAVVIGGTVLLLGGYYAATEGVLMAIASTLVPARVRASGLAVLTTATGLARLASSLLFGALWSVWSLEGAVQIMVVMLAVALLVTIAILSRPERPRRGGGRTGGTGRGTWDPLERFRKPCDGCGQRPICNRHDDEG